MSASRTQTRKGAAQPAENTPQELRNYQLHERIGQEELATIYRATHLTLDRPVHVHLLRRTDWISSSRFQQAARLAARLSHPSLLPVIDAGHDERYGSYLVTPTLNAQLLSEILATGALDPLVALRVATQIGAVLDYLHEQQVVHRDVQPGNILVNPQGVAYLTNLSLAASPEAPDLSDIDEADYITSYSAPEQGLDASSAAPALDIYGLGAVVFHMLSGDIPPAPDVALPSLAQYDPTLADTDPVVQRMMAQEPQARFENASAAVAALRQALRTQIDESTEDMEESRWETSADWLENPLETVLGDRLNQDFLSRSHKRANELHQAKAIRRLLNRWSRKGQFRRGALGQLIQLEQIVSYNVYFYSLRTIYETRTEPEPRQRPQRNQEHNDTLPIPQLWEVLVPDAPAFEDVKPQELALPNSLRVLTCPQCGGSAAVVCQTCNGKGTIERRRRVNTPGNTSSEETVPETCGTCRGYGKQQCPTCDGNGNLVEEFVFTWSRKGRLWENTDDIEDLPIQPLRRRAEHIYHTTINPYEGRWHSVAPLAELLRTAIAATSEDTRLIAAELTILGTPMTEVDYQLNESEQTLYIVGFDNELLGNWTLLNPERILLVALAVIVVLTIIISLFRFVM